MRYVLALLAIFAVSTPALAEHQPDNAAKAASNAKREAKKAAEHAAQVAGKNCCTQGQPNQF